MIGCYDIIAILMAFVSDIALHNFICEIKQNELEVGSDMLLVSDIFFFFNISQYNLKSDTSISDDT